MVREKINLRISFCRTIATVMIIICHLGTVYNSSFVGQFFQSGVQIFLLISGLLYGSRKIEGTKKWWLKRIERICVPCYFYVIVITLLLAVKRMSFSVFGILEIFLNIQGYHHIFTFLSNKMTVLGTGHLWFITVIMLCYLFVYLINRFNIQGVLSKHRSIIIIGLISFSIILGFFGIRTDYFVVFFLGYLYPVLSEKTVSNKKLFVSFVLFTFAVAIRLIGKEYSDRYGDTNIYLCVLIPQSYNMIAVATVIVISWLTNMFKKSFETHRRYQRIHFIFDSLSFYIFVTHYMFIDGPISLAYVTHIKLLNVVIILIATIISAIVLRLFTNRISLIIQGE